MTKEAASSPPFKLYFSTARVGLECGDYSMGLLLKDGGCCQPELKMCQGGSNVCGDRAHVFGALLTNSLPSITASPRAAAVLAAGSPRGGWDGGP